MERAPKEATPIRYHAEILEGWIVQNRARSCGRITGRVGHERQGEARCPGEGEVGHRRRIRPKVDRSGSFWSPTFSRVRSAADARSRQPSHGQLRSTSSGELGPAGQILGSPDALDVLLVLRTGLGLKKPLLHIGDLSGRSLHLVGRERLEFLMPRDRPFTIHLFRSSTFVRLAQTPSAVHRVSAPNPGVPTMFKDGVQLGSASCPESIGASQMGWSITVGPSQGGLCRPRGLSD